MANIQQAAEWMQEGKKVRRNSFAAGEGFFIRSKRLSDDNSGWIAYYGLSLPPSNVVRESPYSDLLDTSDLLAEDWEIDARADLGKPLEK